MKLKIDYKAKKNNNPQQLLLLKQFIEAQQIPQLKKLEFDSNKAQAGQMGEGVATAIATVLNSATGPLTKLFEALVRYVEIQRSDIRIVTPDGNEFCVSAKAKSKDIEKLMDTFYSHVKSLPKSKTTKRKESAPSKDTSKEASKQEQESKKEIENSKEAEG